MNKSQELIYVGTTFPESERRMTRSMARSLGQNVYSGENKMNIVTINLTGDEDKLENENSQIDCSILEDISLDDDFEDDLEEIKALWNNELNKIQRFTLKRTEPLLPIFEHFAKQRNIDLDKIIVHTNNFDLVDRYDSIDSLKLRVTNFLIVAERQIAPEEPYKSKNALEVKCQLKNRKKPIICNIHLLQTFQTVAQQCATEIGCNIDQLKLFFDGDPLSLDTTPESFDFEGGECIDVFVS